MFNRAIYPGTFDPITNGHIDIIKRAGNIFDELIIAVAGNTKKKPYFSLQERINMVSEELKLIPNIIVLGFNSLLVELLKKHEAKILIRGLRAVSDFEYELQLAGMNRKLFPDLETIFLTPSEQHMFISSSLIREIALLDGDIKEFVPRAVIEAFTKKKRLA